ncbi:MAG: Hsp20/alpha crystallin family protein [Bdellovibrionia bacterium]
MTQYFQPRSDVEEFEGHYLVSIDLPGIPKEDVKIEVIDDRLHVSGERKSERKDKKSYARSYGKFEQTFSLPSHVDASKIEARFDNGVLQLALPKVEAAQPRKVEIQAGEKAGFFDRFLNKTKTAEPAKALHS